MRTKQVVTNISLAAFLLLAAVILMGMPVNKILGLRAATAHSSSDLIRACQANLNRILKGPPKHKDPIKRKRLLLAFKNLKAQFLLDGCVDEVQVCAQPPMPPCPQGDFCAQVMPPLQTYDSYDAAKMAHAFDIKFGACGS